MWQPDEWEKWCVQLLRHSFGMDRVQDVKARHGGDLGIEAFTHDGHAVQCYVVEEPVPTRERYEKQRDKLTTDIAKLRTKRDQLLKMLGDVKLHCYFFMVPQWDSKELIQHATAKAAEVKGWSLPFIEESRFRILVVDEDAFAEARGRLLARPRELVSIDPAGGREARAWIGDNLGPFQTMDMKLAPVFPDADHRRRYIESLLVKHIESGNTLTKLRDRFPDQWENVVSCVRERESVLELEHLDGSSPPSASLVKEIVQHLRIDLMRDAEVVGQSAIRGLAWGTVADWLIRCPLDFREVA